MSKSPNHALAVFVAAAIGVLGIILAPTIPTAVFPDLTFPRAIILADSGELPREQMMVGVTRLIEQVAYGVSGTTQVRSITTRGNAEIDVTFGDSRDPVASFELLNSAIAAIHDRMPRDTQIDARLLTTGTFPVIDLSLSSSVRNLTELTLIAQHDMLPRFHRVPGVYRAEVVGAKVAEYVVRLNPAALFAHRLTPQQVVDSLAAANTISSAGRVMDAHRMLETVISARVQGRRDLLSLPVASADGQPVRVSDVATVAQGVHEDYIRTGSEHGPAVLIGISRQTDSNIEELAAGIRAQVTAAQMRYPDVKFSISYDQSGLVREAFASVRDAIALGLGLAFLVVLCFTRSPISAGVALLVVADSVAVTTVVLKLAGLTFNMMTLGGLAAGIGLFIDDAIVMIEGIQRLRAEGHGIAEAVELALSQLRRPLVGSTLTVLVALVPLALQPGISGALLRAVAVTLGAGMLSSLMLALYVTPALQVSLVRRKSSPQVQGRPMNAVAHCYATLARPFLRWPGLGPIGALMVLAVGAFIYPAVGTDYLPAMDEGGFVLDYETPPQSTVEDAERLVGLIEGILRDTPEVAAFSRRSGTQLGFFLTEPNRGDFDVRLRTGRRREIDTVMQSVRARVAAQVPGVRVEFSQVLQDLMGDLAGTPEPIEIKVFGNDQAVIEGTAKRIAAELRKLPGLVDVFDGLVYSSPEQSLVVDSGQAQRYQLSTDDIRKVLSAVVGGTVATSVRVGDHLMEVRVRYPEAYQHDLSKLRSVLLETPGGNVAELASLVRFETGSPSLELDREHLSPVVWVRARLEGTDLGRAVKEINRSLAALTLPVGVSLELGGLYAQQQQAMAGLRLVLIVGLFGVLAVLIWEFRKPAPAVAVLAGALPCLTGGLIGLYLSGLTLNLSSMMGAIMVVGIAAKNGILLLDRAEHALAAGLPMKESMLTAVRERLRPILMTTLATVAGLLPLALGLGAGASVQQPLAVVVIGGLTASLFVSVVVSGATYVLLRRSPPSHLAGLVS